MKKVLIWFINMYQITPTHFHTMCRFSPTCSEYMKISIEKYGAIKGMKLGIKRILKCRPFSKHYGIDNVPTKEFK